MVTAVEEEIFTRVKHWTGFPISSIKCCLKETGVELKDLDYIAGAKDTKANYWKKVFYVLTNSYSWQKIFNRLKVKKRFETIESILWENFCIEN